MASLGFSEKIQENTKDIQRMEEILGKSLKQPFTNTNAGARKLIELV